MRISWESSRIDSNLEYSVVMGRGGALIGNFSLDPEDSSSIYPNPTLDLITLINHPCIPMSSSAGSAPNRSALENRLFKRRLGDRSLPKALHSLLPQDSSLYDQLIDREKKLDFRLLKKQLDIQEALFKTFKVKKPLRVFVSHSACLVDGEWYWTLRVDGRLMVPTAAGIISARRKFTSFIKSLHIQLDPSLYPNEDGFIEWTKVHLSAETDGFEVKRKLVPIQDSTAVVDAKIFLQIDHGCDKFTLSPALQAIVNKQYDSKPQLIMGIWQYVKMHKLQDSEDKRVIRCDETLKAAFEKDSITFSALPG